MSTAMGPLGIPGFFLMFCITLLFVKRLEAVDFTVGDEEGWTTGVNYFQWSQKHNFTVGDTLVFTYVNSQHNVLMVRQRTYMTCNTSQGVLRKYTSGNDQIVLRERKYWFVCDFPGHCTTGMKFELNLLEANNRTTNQTTESPSAPTFPSASAATNHRLGQPRTLLVVLIVFFNFLT